jgi:glutamate dehydrogenase/leucine dehydrogenase
VELRRLTNTDAFLVLDLDGADVSFGVVRLAPKILQDGAELLARSVTYSAAAFELRVGGASAGINTKPDGRDAAIAAFVEEVTPLVEAGSLVLEPGNGVTGADVEPLGATPPDPASGAHSAVAAADGVTGGLAGATVAVAGDGPVAVAARQAAAERGASVVDGGLEAEADLVFVAGRAGTVDHEAAPSVRARTVVPLTPCPVTAKAYAVFQRAGVTYVPDFVALAAPILARFDPGAAREPLTRVREAAVALAADGSDMWMAAVSHAETFLKTWRDELPFGRPLA